MSALQRAKEAHEAWLERAGEKAVEAETAEMGGVFSGKLTIEKYEEARLALEQKLTEANERERAHKEKAALEYQKLCRSISARIGDLKRQQSDALRKYKQDKVYLHSLYRDEKIAINGKMHALKMKYLTDNNIELPKKKVADE